MSTPKTPSDFKADSAQHRRTSRAAAAPNTAVAPAAVQPCIVNVAPTRRGLGPLCSICKTPMVNNGVRGTNHPFVVRIHYLCENCKNTVVVEGRRS